MDFMKDTTKRGLDRKSESFKKDIFSLCDVWACHAELPVNQLDLKNTSEYAAVHGKNKKGASRSEILALKKQPILSELLLQYWLLGGSASASQTSSNPHLLHIPVDHLLSSPLGLAFHTRTKSNIDDLAPMAKNDCVLSAEVRVSMRFCSLSWTRGG
ncbi:hypothetical protein EAE99_009559 [Botrytis elliptica]|nr:hypothetical protein EAE99_009559 [Botrytis elliptica]